MAEKDKKSLEENIDKYKEYFKDDLEAIDEELLKSKEYSKIIDSEIEKLIGPSLGINKGTTRYVVDIIANAVQLQAQRQGLRKDRFAIKKTIMDYAAKFAENKAEVPDKEATDLAEKIAQLIEMDKKSTKDLADMNIDSADLDSVIDNEIDNNGDDD